VRRVNRDIVVVVVAVLLHVLEDDPGRPRLHDRAVRADDQGGVVPARGLPCSARSGP
jgi:hypothetical protein